MRDFQIEVHDLGPIASGVVDIRPLTVFVGPSNTGKTYMSILIYALHRVLGGIRRVPLASRRLEYAYSPGRTDRSRSSLFRKVQVSEHEYEKVQERLQANRRAFMYFDLPSSIRRAIDSAAFGSDGLVVDLYSELNRCFDSENISDVVRTSSSESTIRIGLRAREQHHDMWDIDMNLRQRGSASSGSINDFVLIPEDARGGSSRAVSRMQDILDALRRVPVQFLLDEMLDLWSREGNRRRPESIFYLPAARSGIMQSHRVIAGSLVVRSTRAGLERFPELPAFSGVMADFMQQLILYRRRKAPPTLESIAKELETDTLAGVVEPEGSPGSYPEFIYRPIGSNEHIRLTRASSMVSELAPLVLFLRGVIQIGDTLIIEEPEAHLHPAAQTRMATALARLVRAGLRVLITTHSDWMLKEIGNLMREGALAKQRNEPIDSVALSRALFPREVGIWLFRQGKPDQGSTVQEIPYDHTEGVEPTEYEDVSDELYNRAADLQDKLGESLGRS